MGYAVHRLSLADIVQAAFVALRGALCLFLQVDDFSWHEFVVLVALVVFGEFLVRYAKFLRQAMESVSLAYLYIIVTIEGMYGMKIVACRIVMVVSYEKFVV